MVSHVDKQSLTYVNTEGAGDYMAISPRTLEALRSRGQGPRYVRIGKVIRYRIDWLDEWAKSASATSIAEEIARNR